MSIETATPSQPTSMSPTKEKLSKSDKKKSKSSTHGEKKRKRDNLEDGAQKTKSKKHKSSKHSSSQFSSAPIQNDDSVSPFHLQTSSLYLPLAPVSQKYPLEGLCAEHISPLLLTYYPPFKGVILSYTNPRLSEVPFGSTPITNPSSEPNPDEKPLLLQCIDEYAVSFTWLTADFLLFKPERGVVLEGYINLQNEGHLGLVCWNLFNASIERKRLPKDWEWRSVSTLEDSEKEGGNEGYAEEGAGYWVDGDGEKIDGTVRFRVKEIESSHDRERGFLSIEGTMLSVVEEADLMESEGNNAGSKEKGRRLGGEKSLGATILGVVSEDKEEEGERKHKRRY